MGKESNLEPLFKDPALVIDKKRDFNKTEDERKWRHELTKQIYNELDTNTIDNLSGWTLYI